MVGRAKEIKEANVVPFVAAIGAARQSHRLRSVLLAKLAQATGYIIQRLIPANPLPAPLPPRA